MKEIPLSKGKVALVDDEDYEWLSQWKWSCFSDSHANYAVRNDYSSEKIKHLRMHRVITDAPKGMDVAHLDGDGLNNQRSNLRVCTHAQNIQNAKMRSHNKSGYRGVSWYKTRNKWRACIAVNKKFIHLGFFDDKEEAARVYQEAAVKYHGEFRRTDDA